MSGIVLTFFNLDGKLKAWQRFSQELSGSQGQPDEASRPQSGIPREQLVLGETDIGTTDATTLEAPGLAVPLLGQMIAADLLFDLY